MHCPLSQIGTFPLLSFVFTHSHSHPHDLFFLPRFLPPAVWLWVFWLSPDVDQTPVNNTGQVTPSRLAFCFIIIFLIFSPLFSS